MPTRRRVPSSKNRTAKSKRGTSTRGRQFYSDIATGSTKKTGKKSTKSSAAPSPSSKTRTKQNKSMAPTREFLSEISKVGRRIRRRVKRAL